MRTILDRIGAPQDNRPPAPLVPVVSIADTVADKIVGYLRRTAQDQARLGRDAYDDRLVRPLYDVHVISQRASDQCPLERLISLVARVMTRDQTTYGNQFPAFREDPGSILLDVVASLASDVATERRYEQLCRSLIWGETPPYSEVAASFTDWARAALTGSCIRAHGDPEAAIM